MKIAVTYENGQIFQHFGHSESFKIYEAEGKNIVRAELALMELVIAHWQLFLRIKV